MEVVEDGIAAAAPQSVLNSRRELHEYCSERRVLPIYTIRKSEEDESVIIATCKVATFETTGSGKNKMLARCAAAAAMLIDLKNNGLPMATALSAAKKKKIGWERPSGEGSTRRRPKMEDVDKVFKPDELGPYMKILQEKCLAKGSSAKVAFSNAERVRCTVEIENLGTLIGEGNTARDARQDVGQKAYDLIKQRIEDGTLVVAADFGTKKPKITSMVVDAPDE